MYELLSDRAIILLKGGDALKFIQNFSTNDIEKNEFSYNYLLSNNGRYLFDFFAYKSSREEIYLDCPYIQKESLLKRLQFYKLRADLEIIDLSEDYIFTYSHAEIDKEKALYCKQDPRSKHLGYRAVYNKEIYNKDMRSSLGSSKPGLYFEYKYRYGIVDGYIDMQQDKSIPIEFAGEQQHALSFTKGCYVGQEVISRAKYQGVVRKKIYKLKFGTKIALPIKLADVTDSGGDVLGKVCSNYQNLAIAILREEKYLGLAEKKAMIGGKVAEIYEVEDD